MNSSIITKKASVLALFAGKFMVDSISAYCLLFGKWQIVMLAVLFSISALYVFFRLMKDDKLRKEIIDASGAMDVAYSIPYGLCLMYAFLKDGLILALLLTYIFVTSTTVWCSLFYRKKSE